MWFVEFDENKLRPWLIRNYSLQNVQMQDQFDDAVSNNVVLSEEENINPLHLQYDTSLIELA